MQLPNVYKVFSLVQIEREIAITFVLWHIDTGEK